MEVGSVRHPESCDFYNHIHIALLIEYSLVAFPGAHDRYGRHLLTFPSARFTTIERKYAYSHLLLLLEKHLELLGYRDNSPLGVAFVANLQNASNAVIAAIVLMLEKAQVSWNL